MPNAPALEPAESLPARHVYLAAAVCLVVGLAVGYGSRAVPSHSVAGVAPVLAPTASRQATNPHAPTLDQFRQMADRQAAPLLEKLKTHPGDSALLAQVAAIYHGNHQFKEAAAYYAKAVQADPKNVPLRTWLASSLYRSGDVDGAIAQLNQALAYDPSDANSLFNLGLIRLQGNSDGKGALAAWQQLLKSNPQLSPERKAEVQKLMANVLTTMGNQNSLKGAQAK
jgi:cytochrome c-type biogenesis protein CcmH/NrfG